MTELYQESQVFTIAVPQELGARICALGGGGWVRRLLESLFGLPHRWEPVTEDERRRVQHALNEIGLPPSEHEGLLEKFTSDEIEIGVEEWREQRGERHPDMEEFLNLLDFRRGQVAPGITHQGKDAFADGIMGMVLRQTDHIMKDRMEAASRSFAKVLWDAMNVPASSPITQKSPLRLSFRLRRQWWARVMRQGGPSWVLLLLEQLFGMPHLQPRTVLERKKLQEQLSFLPLKGDAVLNILETTPTAWIRWGIRRIRRSRSDPDQQMRDVVNLWQHPTESVGVTILDEHEFRACIRPWLNEHLSDVLTALRREERTHVRGRILKHLWIRMALRDPARTLKRMSIRIKVDSERLRQIADAMGKTVDCICDVRQYYEWVIQRGHDELVLDYLAHQRSI
ncbi:MAG: hypothetical protein ACYCW6_30285 [Candidatus Xenobia bacterium]